MLDNASSTKKPESDDSLAPRASLQGEPCVRVGDIERWDAVGALRAVGNPGEIRWASEALAH